MTQNKKGRPGWHQATPTTSKNYCNFTSIASRIKAVIIALALWGLLPVKVAEWINQLGGPGDE